MLSRQHHQFVVMVGGCEQRNARCNRQSRNRHHYRIHRFQDGTATDAHIDSQIVATGGFDPAYFGAVVFGAGHFQHRWRVVSPRRAHCRIPVPIGYVAATRSLVFHNSKNRQAHKSRGSHAVSFVAASQNKTRLYPVHSTSVAVRRSAMSNYTSVTREVSLSGDGSAAGWWKSRTHHPALFTRVQIGSVARLRTRHARLAGGARGNNPLLPLSVGAGGAATKRNNIFKKTSCKLGAQTPNEESLQGRR
jgi:hypothetical protein